MTGSKLRNPPLCPWEHKQDMSTCCVIIYSQGHPARVSQKEPEVCRDWGTYWNLYSHGNLELGFKSSSLWVKCLGSLYYNTNPPLTWGCYGAPLPPELTAQRLCQVPRISWRGQVNVWDRIWEPRRGRWARSLLLSWARNFLPGAWSQEDIEMTAGHPYD